MAKAAIGLSRPWRNSIIGTLCTLLVAPAICRASSEPLFLEKARAGYSAADAYRFNADWNLNKFLVPTATGAYSYLHLSEQLPHALIYRYGPVSVLAPSPNPAINQFRLESKATGRNLSLEAMINADNSPVQGVMVLHKGRIAFEQYPGMRPFDSHVWMSNAKVIAGLLVSQLAGEGRIDVEKNLGHYMEATRGTAWESIKVIDVLNMQSGLDLEENAAARADRNSGFSRFMVSELGLPNIDGKVQSHDEALLQIKHRHQSGRAFEYSSANTQMLGRLVEVVTGKRLADLVSERIWMPAGMEGDALLGLTPQGNGIIHGLLSSRLSDMARFGLLYTPSWSVTASRQVVSERDLRNIREGGHPDNYDKGSLGAHLTEVFGEQDLSNSYQWDAVFADGDFYKSGMNGQGIYVSPGRDLVVVWVATGFAEIPMELFARKIATQLY